ncbi:porin [Parahaliea aestuarii]|uniref:porin n=1 Tax=Parahaliea aestuarii TaxID=1852021 RepID=UPI001FE5476E|nr:porin [Parahaliea aestuarii]
MTKRSHFSPLATVPLLISLAGASVPAAAADKALLDILLGNGVITQEQYDGLMQKQSLTSEDILGGGAATPAPEPAAKSATLAEQPVSPQVARQIDVAVAQAVDKRMTDDSDSGFIESLGNQVALNLPVNADYTDKGFRLESKDGRYQTNLQWRAQMRYSDPYRSDPRQVSDFGGDGTRDFDTRRLRMKIGGHGYQPWLKYYFEVDLQPTRDVDDDTFSSSARLITWRADIAKWDWASLRLGQWKVDLNQERVDSSGRQQFVERSIVNRVFTVDRQMGVQLYGHLFQETPADMRYYVGAFTGEGRGTSNDDDNLMYMGRLQWNFLGRDMPWRMTDVEYTEQPTGALAFAGFTNEGVCTRWSSSGCGHLDGYEPALLAQPGQYEIDQWVQEFSFKWRGFSALQEYHNKTIRDSVNNTEDEMTGGFAQAGYFFHHLFPVVPAPLEVAFRYAYVDEPNAVDRTLENERQEYTVGLNWFFSGHNNKLTLDYSHLTLDDEFLSEDVSDNRIRLQWDVSF